jgi:hypothetical protein
MVDCFEKCEQGDAMLQLGLDRVLEDSEELSEEKLHHALLPLRVRETENMTGQATKSCR